MLTMSSDGPFGEDEPYGFSPDALNDMLAQFGAMSSPNWTNAHQIAAGIANAGAPEPNVDPSVRMSYEQLARVAELHIGQATGLDVTTDPGGLRVEAVTATTWTARTVDDYRPLFEQLATSLGTTMREQLADLDATEVEEMSEMLPPGFDIDLSALMAGLGQLLGPSLAVTLAGSVVGQLGASAFGAYELPIPRPSSDTILILAPKVEGFADDWSLPHDDVRLWICLDEICRHAVLRLPHVADRMTALLNEHASGFRPDAEALGEQLGAFDPADPASFGSLNELFTSPDKLVSAMRTDEQRRILPEIEVLVAVVEGYTSHVVDSISARMLSSAGMLGEALRRRRMESSASQRFVERLFGMELTPETLARGRSFVAGVVDRAGEEALSEIWADGLSLPTPAELDAPGLWIERLGLSTDQSLPELEDPPEVPDFPDLDDLD